MATLHACLAITGHDCECTRVLCGRPCGSKNVMVAVRFEADPEDFRATLLRGRMAAMFEMRRRMTAGEV